MSIGVLHCERLTLFIHTKHSLVFHCSLLLLFFFQTFVLCVPYTTFLSWPFINASLSKKMGLLFRRKRRIDNSYVYLYWFLKGDVSQLFFLHSVIQSVLQEVHSLRGNMWKIYCILSMLLIGHSHSIRSELMSRNEITNSVYESNRGRGWMDTAKDALAGPAGQMVVHFAKEMISRSTGNSQVMNLCDFYVVYVVIAVL